MPAPHPARTPRRPRQRGMTLISVLVSLLIFAFGLLSLAGLYARLLSAQTGNEMATSTQVFGNRFWALLQAHPGLVQALKAQGSSVTYTQASMGGAPAGLQPLLRDVFSSKSLSLPDASVTITLGSDAHRPEDVGCFIRQRQELLRTCGFRSFTTFERGRPQFQAL